MRAREFIVEYDRGMTLKSWEQKLTARMAGDQSAPETIDEIMEMIESADPTRNKMYAQWIVKRYVAGDFAADDLDQVNLRLTDYDSVKKSLTTGKDINQLTYAQLHDIIQAGKAQKTAPKFEVIPDTEVLYNGPDGQLAVPQTETASRALGSGTAWCTAWTNRDTMFDQYNSSGRLYTWRAKNGDKFQFYWGNNIQFMNSANKPLSPKDMHFYRSINPPTKKLFAKYEDEFLKTGKDSRILTLFNVLNKSQTVWEEALAVDAVAAFAAYQHAKNINGRYPAGEAAIATSAEYSYRYAMLIKESFPAGEAAIATSAEYSCYYATLIKEPFPAGEPAIATSAEWSYEYANWLDQPFPAGEAVIATDVEYSYEYATMLDKPFPAGEEAIANDDSYRLLYTRNILKFHRSPSWENLIKNNPRRSYEYAMTLNQPFPLGEPAILKDQECSREYVQTVLRNHRSPSWEKLIKDNPDASYEYATVLNDRFPAGEAAIATKSLWAMFYDSMFGTNLSKK